LTPAQRERAGVAQALAENWLGYDSTLPSRARDNPELRYWASDERERVRSMAIEDRITGLPGYATPRADQIPAIMAAYYRKEAARYVLPLPQNLIWVDDLVPTHTEDWLIGDDVQEIDWASTLSLRGAQLGTIMPLKRRRASEFEASERPL